jgi:hypothetical protein
MWCALFARYFVTGCCLFIACGLSASAAAQDEPLDFSRDILPILSDKCFVCHGPDTPAEIDLRLDTEAAATEDRGGYRAVDREHPEESELLIRIESEFDPMPPADADKQLTDEEKQLLRRWIEAGGRYAQHWAFVPPRKRTEVDGIALQPHNAIDVLIGRKQKQQGVEPAAPAEPNTLARRVALTLTGLPPRDEVLSEFLSQPDEAGYERLVERLLADPRFGEHQARYWLDAVRYGDTHGLHLDNRRGIYPYRDWVVRAFNENLPLDDFIRWQLAGDLMEDPSLEQQIATGFVRMNPTTSEGGVIPAEFQAKNNFDRTETLGTVLLGMTLTCARCHTHKYDPITQTEYYRLLAFFNSTAERPLDGNAYAYGPTVSVPRDQAQWQQWTHLRGEIDELLATAESQLDLHSVLSAARERSTEDKSQGGAEAAQPLTLPAEADWARLSRQQRLEALARGGESAGDAGLAARAIALREQWKGLQQDFTTTLVARELDKPRPTRLLRRGEYNMPTGEPLTPDVPEIMGRLSEDAPRDRLGLAQWLTDPRHPLVARVLVNRLWQRVFGAGLVRTPEDFGLQGERPTHPILLDWLAVELIDSGWDLKHMLRLMVRSDTFRQSSAHRADIDDPENRLWARGPSYRLDAEVLRDLALWASGLLDPKMGGEGVKPYQPAGMWKAMAHPASNTKEYQRDQGAKLYRRSLYVYWKRTSPHPMMTLFDAPDRESSCVRRSRTSTPLQSLAMFNETQRLEMARKLAERLLIAESSDEARLDHLYRQLICRPPNDRERNACLDLLAAMRTRFAEAPADAKALLAIGDAPRDENLPEDALAAWTQLCVTVLASDAAILLY